MVIEDAGVPGGVTIATNMAGRGTDIVLGGKSKDKDENWKVLNEEVLKNGGHHFLKLLHLILSSFHLCLLTFHQELYLFLFLPYLLL